VEPAPAPVEETTAEVTEQPTVMGAPPITKETTVEETTELAPEESAGEISGDTEPVLDSGTAELVEKDGDGAESVDMGTSDVVEEQPMEPASAS
jgi:hypothetical protein